MTSASVPPLAATMTAARPIVACRALSVTPAPALTVSRSLANPARSRARSRLRASAPALTPEAASQRRDGRNRSAQMARITPIDSRIIRSPVRMPCASSQPAARSCFQPGPAVSAPLASHRCCQVPPG